MDIFGHPFAMLLYGMLAHQLGSLAQASEVRGTR